jgi:hypothetical protein
MLRSIDLPLRFGPMLRIASLQLLRTDLLLCLKCLQMRDDRMQLLTNLPVCAFGLPVCLFNVQMLDSGLPLRCFGLQMRCIGLSMYDAGKRLLHPHKQNRLHPFA